MDSKKVIERLVKIADNQQKIIQKLAQQAGLEPPAQQLAPQQPLMRHEIGPAVTALMSPQAQAMVHSIVANDRDYTVSVTPKAGANASLVKSEVEKAVTQLRTSGRLFALKGRQWTVVMVPAVGGGSGTPGFTAGQ